MHNFLCNLFVTVLATHYFFVHLLFKLCHWVSNPPENLISLIKIKCRTSMWPFSSWAARFLGCDAGQYVLFFFFFPVTKHNLYLLLS